MSPHRLVRVGLPLQRLLGPLFIAENSQKIKLFLQQPLLLEVADRRLVDLDGELHLYVFKRLMGTCVPRSAHEPEGWRVDRPELVEAGVIQRAKSRSRTHRHLDALGRIRTKPAADKLGGR